MPLSVAQYNYYTRQTVMSDPGEHASMLQGIEATPRAAARAIQGLVLHEHIAAAYGVTISDERRAEVHVRRNADRLAAIVGRDARPLIEPRAPANRLIGNCRHFTVQAIAVLKAHGVPARARCGFGTYFEPGKHVDHWVGEYWNDEWDRWVLFDAQIDGLQRGIFKPDFDLMDVPCDRFLVAGEAWIACREGRADPATFGILNEHGPWFIAGNLIRDVAALNGMEMLPWDDWGAMVGPDDEMTDERLAYFDGLAALTHDPSASFDALRERYQNDEGLRVPERVMNVLRQSMEPV
jgi:hypothetical protein